MELKEFVYQHVGFFALVIVHGQLLDFEKEGHLGIRLESDVVLVDYLPLIDVDCYLRTEVLFFEYLLKLLERCLSGINQDESGYKIQIERLILEYLYFDVCFVFIEILDERLHKQRPLTSETFH